MFLMGIFWYHLYDMSNYKLCNLDTYNHNFGSRVELAMEGERIFDLLRWDAVKDVFGDGKQIKLHFYSDYLPETSSDKFKTVPGLTKYPTDHILFPIPQYEMDQNKAIIENNPGY